MKARYSENLIAAVLSLLLCLSLAAPALAAPLPADVDETAWYADAVQYVLDNGLMVVGSDGTFDPDAAVTDGGFAKSLQVLGDATPADAYEAPLTREQAVSALYGYAVDQGIDVSVGEDTNILSYNDAFDISEGCAAAFQWACGAGIINGTGGGNLDPQGILTRAQAAAILTRYCTKAGAYSIRPLVGEAVDYSDADNWLALPAGGKAVDTFYIYPTVFGDTVDGPADTFPIDDANMRAGARRYYEEQATVFEASTNVYAPYYRQTLLDTFGRQPLDQIEAFQSQEQRTDLYAALDYYFEHYNNGKPFILAGHSQGAIMTRIILKEYMKAHPDRYARMIAAYAIGYSVTKSDLAQYPHLKFAEGADDTGVIVSWNTEGPDNGESTLVLDGAIAINPINWKRDDTYAPASENLGSRLRGDDGAYTVTAPGVADAQVDVERGVVICTNTDIPYLTANGAPIFGGKSFHTLDYDLYYENIRENVQTRIAAWFLKNGGYKVEDLVGTATDYSKPENWIAQPEASKAVDTFYIYPTAYMPAEADAPVICDIGNAGMRAMALNNYNNNKGAYEGSTNVFAPYYRQTSVAALENYGAEGAAEILSREPRTDLYAALDYYFEDLNGGRPFILAGHSQGSMLMRIILKDYMPAHPEYYARMVAAYAIGYSITRDDLDRHPWLRFAGRADDTGVIVSWNTEGPGNGESKLVLPGAISINPINWKRDDTYAPASENLGSLVDGEIVTPGVADAQVDAARGVVVCTADLPYIDTSAIASTPVFGEKSFHGNDYTFYYANLRKNVADRIAAYQAKNG